MFRCCYDRVIKKMASLSGACHFFVQFFLYLSAVCLIGSIFEGSSDIEKSLSWQLFHCDAAVLSLKCGSAYHSIVIFDNKRLCVFFLFNLLYCRQAAFF